MDFAQSYITFLTSDTDVLCTVLLYDETRKQEGVAKVEHFYYKPKEIFCLNK